MNLKSEQKRIAFGYDRAAPKYKLIKQFVNQIQDRIQFDALVDVF